MASQAYFRWVDDGRPWKFARPVVAVGDILRAHGYTVYYKGNQSHLEHEPPEDHTPFSATGWPIGSPYPYCMAMDIMPPAEGQRSKITGQPLPSLRRLAAQLRADKMAGHDGADFVKYLNWEPEGTYIGPCYHESWTPGYARRTSTDRGHIHVSARSDVANSAKSDGYDLVARVLGTPAVEESGMSAAEAKQGFADAIAEAVATTDADTTNDTTWGRQFRKNWDALNDFSNTAGPLATAVASLTTLVVQQSPASAEDIALALAPLINGQIGGGATPAEVEDILRRVFGGLDNA